MSPSLFLLICFSYLWSSVITYEFQDQSYHCVSHLSHGWDSKPDINNSWTEGFLLHHGFSLFSLGPLVLGRIMLRQKNNMIEEHVACSSYSPIHGSQEGGAIARTGKGRIQLSILQSRALSPQASLSNHHLTVQTNFQFISELYNYVTVLRNMLVPYAHIYTHMVTQNTQFMTCSHIHTHMVT